MFNLHAIEAVDHALTEIAERSIVFTTEMTNLLHVIKARLTHEDIAADVELDLTIQAINDPAIKAAAVKALPTSALFPSDSVVPTSKMTDFLLDLRTILGRG